MTMTKHNRAVAEHLSTPATTGLGGLLQHANYLHALAPKVQHKLPETIAKHCQLANYRQGRLILAVDNQAIATRLRFTLPDLRQQLRQDPDFCGLIGIDFYISKPEQLALLQQTKVPQSRIPRALTTTTDVDNIDIADTNLRTAWVQLLQYAAVTK